MSEQQRRSGRDRGSTRRHRHDDDAPATTTGVQGAMTGPKAAAPNAASSKAAARAAKVQR